jgi:hypothetical protein
VNRYDEDLAYAEYLESLNSGEQEFITDQELLDRELESLSLEQDETVAQDDGEYALFLRGLNPQTKHYNKVRLIVGKIDISYGQEIYNKEWGKMFVTDYMPLAECNLKKSHFQKVDDPFNFVVDEAIRTGKSIGTDGKAILSNNKEVTTGDIVEDTTEWIVVSPEIVSKRLNRKLQFARY